MSRTSPRNAVALWYGAQVRARRAFDRLPLGESQKIYFLPLAIGVLGGLAAVLFHLLLDFLQDHIIYRIAGASSWWRIPAVSQLPVVSPTDPANLLGIITMHDIARALARMDSKSRISKLSLPY